MGRSTEGTTTAVPPTLCHAVFAHFFSALLHTLQIKTLTFMVNIMKHQPDMMKPHAQVG